ncbi:MAG: photosystem II biogenesis protein Psp29 [Cuspidothrix sp.]
MNNVRTVSDTKRTFYTLHTRPINTIYRRVVEELMVEMHLLSVNVDFSYDAIYALGVATTFDRFMEGYQPTTDQDSIFRAICQAVEQDPQHYRQDASKLKALAASLPIQDLIAGLSQDSSLSQDADLQKRLEAIKSNTNFKYSRLFGVGLLSLLLESDAEFVKDDKQRAEALKAIANGLHLPEDKLIKDLELYSSNLEKMAQALIVMADILSADRKKREQREQELNTSAS